MKKQAYQSPELSTVQYLQVHSVISTSDVELDIVIDDTLDLNIIDDVF